MTQQEFKNDHSEMTDMPLRFKEGFHRGAVKDALNAGKSVPAEVLKDYPDLKK